MMTCRLGSRRLGGSRGSLQPGACSAASELDLSSRSRRSNKARLVISYHCSLSRTLYLLPTYNSLQFAVVIHENYFYCTYSSKTLYHTGSAEVLNNCHTIAPHPHVSLILKTADSTFTDTYSVHALIHSLA